MNRWTRTLIGAVVVGVYLFPVYWLVATSIKTNRDVFAVPPQLIPRELSLESYDQALLQNEVVQRSILNSVVIATGTMVLTLALAAPAAYALARLRLRITAAAVLLLLVGQMLPTISLAVPLFVIFRHLGLINSYPGLILANTVFTLPLAIIILRPFFLGVPSGIEEAARVDGCTQFGAFRRVVLPVVLPGVVTAATISFVLAWGELVFGLTLTSSQEMQPITVTLTNFIGQYGTRWNDLMGVAAAAALPIVLIFVGLQRYIVHGLTAGATKE